MNTKEEIRYEDNAHTVTVTGWACKKCNRWWGKDEHMARYCCATTLPCECGARREKSWTHCDECRRKKECERWYAKPEVEWDGAYPIGVWNNDVYFFDEGSLIDYLQELANEDDLNWLESIENVWLTPCTPNVGRDFCMSEYLCDDLPEDGDLDDEEINKTVNEWITAHAPFSWSMIGKRLSTASVKARLR